MGVRKVEWAPGAVAMTELPRPLSTSEVIDALLHFNRNRPNFDEAAARRVIAYEEQHGYPHRFGSPRTRIRRHTMGDPWIEELLHVHSFAQKVQWFRSARGEDVPFSPTAIRDSPERWVTSRALRGNLNLESAAEVRAFLSAVKRMVEYFEASYLFATTEPVLARDPSLDPREHAFPVMVLPNEPPDFVVSSPAFYVEQLPHGARWIEIAQNPFLVTHDEMDALAEHVGLKPSPVPSSVNALPEGPE